MGVIDEATAAEPSRRGVSCRLREWLQSIDPVTADEFRALLWDPRHRRIPHTTVEDLLTKYGCAVPASSVGRHRRRRCANCAHDAAKWVT